MSMNTPNEIAVALRTNPPVNGDHLPLAVLMNRNGADKLWLHHYDDEYERHFTPIRDAEFTLLEIGVGGYNNEGRGGDGLKTWRDYFPHARVVGIDLEDKSFLDSDRLTTRICDQSDGPALIQLNEENGPFSIIIDDGSHQQKHILTSFYTLFPLLSRGGIYVIEDLETAYRLDYGGDPDLKGDTSVGLVQRLIDGLHWQFWKGRGPREIDQMVKSVHVSKELAFIYKQ